MLSQQILHGKQQQQRELLNKTRNVSRFRQLRSQQALARKHQKVIKDQQLKQHKALEHENEIISIFERLQSSHLSKDKQKQINKTALRDAKRQQKQWALQSQVSQKLRWKNYSDGMETFVKEQQKSTIKNYQLLKEVREKDIVQRKKHKANLRKQKEQVKEDYDIGLQESKRISETVKSEEMENKSQQVEAIKNGQVLARTKYLQTKPFEQRLESTRSMSKSRSIHTTKSMLV